MKKNTARILSFLLSVLTVAVCFTGCYYDNGKKENKEEDLPSYKQEVEEEEIEVDNSINVYIAPTGKRYHRLPTCAGRNARQTTINKALEMGRTPCRRCIL